MRMGDNVGLSRFVCRNRIIKQDHLGGMTVCVYRDGGAYPNVKNQEWR